MPAVSHAKGKTTFRLYFAGALMDQVDEMAEHARCAREEAIVLIVHEYLLYVSMGIIPGLDGKHRRKRTQHE